MIQWVWETAKKSSLGRVVIATDSDLIAQRAEDFSAEVVITGCCDSGGKRCWEAASSLLVRDSIILNIQCDEPTLHPKTIDRLIERCKSSPYLHYVATSYWWSKISMDYEDANVVKIVAKRGTWGPEALYFSRRSIPYQKVFRGFMKHIGIYAYSDMHVLKRIAVDLFDTPEGVSEELEQLKILQISSLPFLLSEAESDSTSVDTPYDLVKVKAREGHLYSA